MVHRTPPASDGKNPGRSNQAESRTMMLSRHHRLRVATSAAALAALLASGSPPHSSGQLTGPTAEWQAFQKTVQPFLAKHCFDCHTDEQRGDVWLDRFDEQALAKHSPTLEKVLDV